MALQQSDLFVTPLASPSEQGAQSPNLSHYDNKQSNSAASHDGPFSSDSPTSPVSDHTSPGVSPSSINFGPIPPSRHSQAPSIHLPSPTNTQVQSGHVRLSNTSPSSSKTFHHGPSPSPTFSQVMREVFPSETLDGPASPVTPSMATEAHPFAVNPLTPPQTTYKSQKRQHSASECDTTPTRPSSKRVKLSLKAAPRKRSIPSQIPSWSMFFVPPSPKYPRLGTEELKHVCQAVLCQIDWAKVKAHVGSNREAMDFRDAFTGVLEEKVTEMLETHDAGHLEGED